MSALESGSKLSKQKVLFIVPSLRRAGAESQLVSLVNSLSASKFEKHLLFYRPEEGLMADVDSTEVTIHKLDRRSKIDLSLGKAIGNIIDAENIEIIHCTLQNAMLYGLLGRFFAVRSPRIVTAIHTTENADIKHDVADRIFYRPMLKRCEQVWFVSSTQAARWIGKFPFLSSNHRVIHNGIDLQKFDPARFRENGKAFRDKLGIAPEETVLCCVAGFRKEKLHTILIDAFRTIRKDHDQCRLLLAGEGPMEEDIRTKVDEYNLQSDVVFLGSLDDVRDLLAASNIKILASAAETFSMAMLEAMAMQVPVISTSVGGAAEAIEDGRTGHLVRPADVQHLVSTIKPLLVDKDHCAEMGRQARKAVVERFGLGNMVDTSTNSLLEMSSVPAAAEGVGD